MREITCSVCGVVKNESAFSPRHDTPSGRRKQCKTCQATYFREHIYKRDAERTQKRRIAAIQGRGGACEQCGYNKSYAALCFHHVGPKRFKLDQSGFRSHPTHEIMYEISKCVLLCANCHMEHHFGIRTDM